MNLTTQLNFGGNCEEAIRLYEAIFEGTVTRMVKQSEMPAQYNVPPERKNDVVHARMRIGAQELIANDVPPEIFQPIRSSYLYLSVDSTEEAERIWNALAERGVIGMPIAETFFAFRFGQLRDRFGTLWSIIHPRPM